VNQKQAQNTRIKVRRQRTISTAPYESYQIELSIEEDVDSLEQVPAKIKALKNIIIPEVNRQEATIRKKMEAGEL
jgi:hypothetical protein